MRFFGRGRHERQGARRHGGGDETVTLDRVRPGEDLEVVEVDDDEARVQALRLGVCEGSDVSCVAKLPCGPVVLRSGLQEIAIGRGLARRIHVRRDHRGRHGAR